MTPKQRTVWFLGGILLGAIVFNWLGRSTAPAGLNCASVEIQTPSREPIRAELAQTTEERRTGLANRDTLAQGSGMLFLFPTSDIHSFWMKDTRIPLDIIWLQNKEVVEIATLRPQSGESIPQHTPLQKADAVLEVNAGEANLHGITLGSILNWDTEKCN